MMRHSCPSLVFFFASLALLQACADNGSSTTCSLNVTTETSGVTVGVKQPTFGSSKVAQSITFAEDTTLANLQLKLKKTGSPTGTLTLVVETNSASAPSGSALYMSDGNSNSATLDVSSVSSVNSDFYTFTFATSITLQSGNLYWVTLAASYNASSTDLIVWMANSGNIYSSGSPMTQNVSNSIWSTAINTDISAYDLLIKGDCT